MSVYYNDITNCIQDHTTYLLKAPVELRGTGYMWRTLEKTPEVKDNVAFMRMCKDRQVRCDIIQMQTTIS